MIEKLEELYRQRKIQRELKKYNKREFKLAQERNFKSNIIVIILIVVILIVAGMYYLGYRYKAKDLPIIVMIVLIITNIFLWISNMSLRRDINLYQKSENVREDRVIRSIEYKANERKNQITHIVLKNEEGYDVKTWSVGKANSLIIGKTTRIRVDIDLTDASYASLISKNHAILNKTDNGWFLEDLGSVNGTGVQKLSDNRKIKVKTGPVKVESGDIIYIATTALLLR